jgi:hypothetical protein
MSLTIAAIQSELLRNGVLITGAPRSGTTLLGKLVGSLERLEYHFEPPSLYMLGAAAAAGELPMPLAQQLLTVYLCEDLLLESAHGRGVNLRPTDDSQVLHRLQWGELHERWHQVGNRAEAIAFCQHHELRLALKMPNLFDALELMRHTMDGLKIVVSVRNGVDVIRSIVHKGWVGDDSLKRDLWPYAPHTGHVAVPYWVPEVYRQRWVTMNMTSRATLMWTVHAALGLAQRGKADVYEVRYEELVASPWQVLEQLFAWLGHSPTLHTRRWIESIHPPRQVNDLPSIEASDDPDLAQWFDQVNQAWGY